MLPNSDYNRRIPSTLQSRKIQISSDYKSNSENVAPRKNARISSFHDERYIDDKRISKFTNYEDKMSMTSAQTDKKFRKSFIVDAENENDGVFRKNYRVHKNAPSKFVNEDDLADRTNLDDVIERTDLFYDSKREFELLKQNLEALDNSLDQLKRQTEQDAKDMKMKLYLKSQQSKKDAYEENKLMVSKIQTEQELYKTAMLQIKSISMNIKKLNQQIKLLEKDIEKAKSKQRMEEAKQRKVFHSLQQKEKKAAQKRQRAEFTRMELERILKERQMRRDQLLYPKTEVKTEVVHEPSLEEEEEEENASPPPPPPPPVLPPPVLCDGDCYPCEAHFKLNSCHAAFNQHGDCITNCYDKHIPCFNTCNANRCFKNVNCNNINDFYFNANVNNEQTKDSSTKKNEPYVTNFNLVTILNRGCFSEVALVVSNLTGNKYIVKTVCKRDNISRICRMKNVFTMMAENKHPFLVTMYDCMQNNNQVFFVVEHLIGGSLKDYLVQFNVFNEYETAFYSGCAILAINHLHSLDIAHRNIKLENFILDDCGYAKLVDFDLAIPYVTYNTPLYDKSGTAMYKSPEYFKPSEFTTRATDFWALGVVIHALLTAKCIFIKPCLRLAEDHLSSCAEDLLVKMLHLVPSRRLGSGCNGGLDIMKHDFYKDIDWVSLFKRQIKPPQRFINNVNKIIEESKKKAEPPVKPEPEPEKPPVEPVVEPEPVPVEVPEDPKKKKANKKKAKSPKKKEAKEAKEKKEKKEKKGKKGKKGDAGLSDETTE